MTPCCHADWLLSIGPAKPIIGPLPRSGRLRRCGAQKQSCYMTVNTQEINRHVQELRAFLVPLYTEMEKVIVGQRTMIDRLLTGLLTGGHLLLEGVPGLAKTLAVRTLAQGLHLSFHRIQF